MHDESSQHVTNLEAKKPVNNHLQVNSKKKNTQKLSVYASPLGSLLIRHSGRSIQQIKYLTTNEVPTESLDTLVTSLVSLPKRWQQYLNDYFCGDFKALNHLPIRLDQGTAFQQQVWLALRKTKAGETLSYLQLANLIHRPKSVRAVGQALRRNPVVIILPCHRIIQQSGALGGYEGDMLLGTGRKQFLLWHEGVIIAPNKSTVAGK